MYTQVKISAINVYHEIHEDQRILIRISVEDHNNYRSSVIYILTLRIFTNFYHQNIKFKHAKEGNIL